MMGKKWFSKEFNKEIKDDLEHLGNKRYIDNLLIYAGKYIYLRGLKDGLRSRTKIVSKKK